MSLHHIVPKHRGGYKWRDKNVIPLKEHFHWALHTMFWDASPTQQIQEILFFDAPEGQKFLDLALYLWRLQKKSATRIYKPGIVVQPSLLHLPINYRCKSPSKILRANWVLFWEIKHTEEKIWVILSVWKKSLQQEFSELVKNLLG